MNQSIQYTGLIRSGIRRAAGALICTFLAGALVSCGSGAKTTSMPDTAGVTYSVSYNGNSNTGGSVPIDANTYATGATVTVLGNTGTLVKSGYTFAGWNTAADGTGTNDAGGGTFVMGSADVTLYAQWITNTNSTYSVSYNGNGSTGGTVPTDPNLYANGVIVAVLGNTGALVKTGYSFAGWNTMANGTGTNYVAGNSFVMGSANVTLYAQWSAVSNVTYSVTYNGNGSTGGTVPTDSNMYASGATVTVLGNTGNLVRTGYTFAGWNTAADGSGTNDAGGGTFVMGSANVTLYAQWTTNTSSTYSVSYIGNGSTGGTAPTDPNLYANGVIVAVLGNTGALVKTGYSFAGWNTKANGSGTSYVAGNSFVMGSANVTLYAQWSVISNATYSVTYNGNGSTGGSVPTDSNMYASGATVTVLGNTGNLVRTGYTFTRWNTTANGSGTNQAAGGTFVMGSANVTLYAQWTPSGDPTVGVLPSYNDAYASWQNAGLQSIGGIPNRTTVCATVSPIGGGSDDYSNIQAAINSCKAGQVVQLAPGSSTAITGSISGTTLTTTAGTPAIGDVVIGPNVISGTRITAGSGTSWTVSFTQTVASESMTAIVPFTVKLADLPIQIATGISLRGTGSCSGSNSPYCSSIIEVANGMLPYDNGMCGTSTSAPTACPNGGAPVILMSNGNAFYGFSWAQCGNVGSNAGTGCGAVQLAADAAQGQTTVQLTSTSGFSVGDWVLIDEASGAEWEPDPLTSTTGYVNVWGASDWLSSSPSATVNGVPSATARVMWPKAQSNSGNYDFPSGQYPYQVGNEGCWFSYCDRPTSEIHKITSIGAGPCPGTSCTLTFDDPLTVAFRRSGPSTITASISGTTLTVTSGSGEAIGQLLADSTNTIKPGTYITAGSGNSWTVSASQTVASESMYIAAHGAQVYKGPYPNTSGTGTPGMLEEAGLENLSVLRGPNGNVTMLTCAYCWIENVELADWYGGGVAFEESVRSEIIGSYIHHVWDAVNSGGEYSINLNQHSTEILITNNIITFGGKDMVAMGGGAGSVVSYNYADDSMYDSYSGIGDYWVETFGPSHFVGPHHILYEGNWAENLDADLTHGNSTYETFFRNVSTGLRTPFHDPSLPSSYNEIDDFTGVGYACGGNGPSGCSLQAPGPLRATGPMAYNYWFAFVGNVLGVSGKTTSANGWSYTGDWNGNRIFMLGYNTGPGGQDPYLNGVDGSYVFISGNYDYLHNSIYAWASGYSKSLPNSFYLSSAPSFFSAGACTYTWPWVTPTGSTPIQTNSCSGSGLPAQARWNAGTPFVQP